MNKQKLLMRILILKKKHILDLYDDEDNDDVQVQMIDNDRFRISYHIPQFFFPQIIGSKGTTKKRIEAETKTQILIPKPGVEGDVIITGSTRQSVLSAQRKINLIVLAARNKQQFTHFLCVPFTAHAIKESFNKFKNEILSGPEIPGLDESLFQNPNKLHLTIATLSLMDNEDRALAAETLQDCKETVIEPVLEEHGGIDLTLHGLEYMNDDPSSIDVLYENGLTQKKNDSVKLHVTVINSLFRDEQYQDNNHKDNYQLRHTFDGRKIIETYGDYYFGIQHVDEIHLSQRYSTSCNGFYEATGILKF